MSTAVVQTTDDSVEDVPSQTIVSSSIVVPSTSIARRSSRYEDDSHPKRRASEDGGRRSQEEAKRPRLNMADGEVKKRGQRMFGMIIGTLTKFKAESQNKTEAEIKREQIDLKLQEKLKKEKEDLMEKMKQEELEKRERIAKQRKEEDERRKSELEDCWTNQQKNLANFLCTTTEPRLYYLPARLSPKDVETIAEQKRELALASTLSTVMLEEKTATETNNNNDDVAMEGTSNDYDKDAKTVVEVKNEQTSGNGGEAHGMEIDSDLKTDKASSIVAEEKIKSNTRPAVTEDIETTNRKTATDPPSQEENSTGNDEPPQEEDVSMKEGEAEEVVEY